jgi:hypothetical protein
VVQAEQPLPYSPAEIQALVAQIVAQILAARSQGIKDLRATLIESANQVNNILPPAPSSALVKESLVAPQDNGKQAAPVQPSIDAKVTQPEKKAVVQESLTAPAPSSDAPVKEKSKAVVQEPAIAPAPSSDVTVKEKKNAAAKANDKAKTA